MSKPKLFIFAGVSLAIIGGAIFAWRLGYFIKISEFFAAEQTLTIKTITNTHRYDPGKMFGGWGSHLGHLLRAPDGSLWFADDTGNDNPTENDILSLVRVFLDDYGFFYDYRWRSGWSRLVIITGKNWLRQKYQNCEN